MASNWWYGDPVTGTCDKCTGPTIDGYCANCAEFVQSAELSEEHELTPEETAEYSLDA
jgi:methionyl-tRNA synthetase